MTSPGAAKPRSPWHDRHLRAGIILLAAGVIILGGIIAGNYFLTIAVATRTTTAIEKARDQAEVSSGLRECTALQGLAMIKGSHIAAATYGYNLETGIKNVYQSSGCPDLLKQYGPRS